MGFGDGPWRLSSALPCNETHSIKMGIILLPCPQMFVPPTRPQARPQKPLWPPAFVVLLSSRLVFSAPFQAGPKAAPSRLPLCLLTQDLPQLQDLSPPPSEAVGPVSCTPSSLSNRAFSCHHHYPCSCPNRVRKKCYFQNSWTDSPGRPGKLARLQRVLGV